MKAYKDEILMEDNSQIDLIEQSLQRIKEDLFRIEIVLGSIYTRQDMFETSLHSLSGDIKSGFKDINDRQWKNFFFMISGFGMILGVLGHAFHWI